MENRRTKPHKPPARLRYEESHPNVTCRLDQEIYNQLNARLKELNVSFATFVKDALGNLELSTNKARKEGYEQGSNEAYAQAYEDARQFDLGNCEECGEPLHWNLNTKAHQYTLDEIVNQVGFAHRDLNTYKNLRSRRRS